MRQLGETERRSEGLSIQPEFAMMGNMTNSLLQRAGMFAAVLLAGVLIPESGQAQIRFTEVTLSTRNVELTNFGSTTVNLSAWFFVTDSLM